MITNRTRHPRTTPTMVGVLPSLSGREAEPSVPAPVSALLRDVSGLAVLVGSVSPPVPGGGVPPPSWPGAFVPVPFCRSSLGGGEVFGIWVGFPAGSVVAVAVDDVAVVDVVVVVVEVVVVVVVVVEVVEVTVVVVVVVVVAVVEVCVFVVTSLMVKVAGA